MSGCLQYEWLNISSKEWNSLRCWNRIKKVFSDMEKGSETLDVSSRRDEFIGRAISLLELTSKVPEAFSVTLRILVFSGISNKIMYDVCSILSNFALIAIMTNLGLETAHPSLPWNDFWF